MVHFIDMQIHGSVTSVIDIYYLLDMTKAIRENDVDLGSWLLVRSIWNNDTVVKLPHIL